MIITHKYWIGKYEVTQKIWEEVMGFENNHSIEKHPNLPVNNISWALANEFCKRLTERERKRGRLPRGYEYRLPTEAQWEYACRAGTTTAFNNGKNLDLDNIETCLDDIAWYKSNSSMLPHAVGTKKPNAWGIYDMHGNVREWCLDGVFSYPCITQINPLIKNKRFGYRVRGGSCCDSPQFCRSSVRFHELHGGENGEMSLIGFRIVLTPILYAELILPKITRKTEVVSIEPGKYMMGSLLSEIGSSRNEAQKECEIKESFQMGKYEVTQEQWEEVGLTNNAILKDRNLPIYNISWEQAMEYCRRLTDSQRFLDKFSWEDKVTLPTEAQWEYACRAGTTQSFNNNQDLESLEDPVNVLGKIAWFKNNSHNHPHPVGKKEPNYWGLYDMHGNVWEFTIDTCLNNFFYENSINAKKRNEDIIFKIIRGGSWDSYATECRSAEKQACLQNFVQGNVGFRVIKVKTDPIKAMAKSLLLRSVDDDE